MGRAAPTRLRGRMRGVGPARRSVDAAPEVASMAAGGLRPVRGWSYDAEWPFRWCTSCVT
jgi:hypothetical protein